MILQWVSDLCASGLILKRKPPGRSNTVNNARKLMGVKISIEQSLTHSAQKHAIALGISDQSL